MDENFRDADAHAEKDERSWIKVLPDRDRERDAGGGGAGDVDQRRAFFQIDDAL